MTLRTVLRTAEKFVIDNSPGILTGLGVVGVVTSAVLTGRAAYSSALWLETNDPDGMNSTKANIQETWRYYVPAAFVLSATITSIIMANSIGSRRAAAITAAFKLSEKMSEEYREKVLQTLGKKPEEKMRAELAAEKMSRTPGADMIIVTGSEVLFFDEMSGRYFKNDVESVRKAVNEINHQVNNHYYASLTEFYEKIGLERTIYSDEVGWNSDELLEVIFSATLTSDNRPAISIMFNKNPIAGFDRCS
jgi:hypothetical protein